VGENGTTHQATLAVNSAYIGRLQISASLRAVATRAIFALDRFRTRVATARKLAEICWKRLRRWQRTHAEQAA